jgi:DNA-binding FrmR family transcriptional regulator
MANTNHKDEIIRLNRIKGQIEAITKMIEDQKPCVEIINQVNAANGALMSTRAKILERHLSVCIANVLSGKEKNVTKEIEELINLIKKF